MPVLKPFTSFYFNTKHENSNNFLNAEILSLTKYAVLLVTCVCIQLCMFEQLRMN